MKRFRVLAGLSIWVVLAGFASLLISACPSAMDRAEQTTGALWRFAAGQRREVVLELDRSLDVRRGDPVFSASDYGAVVQVGEIASVESGGGFRARAVFYSSAPPLGPAARLDYHQAPGSMNWILETMLPPAKREEIAAVTQDAVRQHHADLAALLQPVIEDAVRDAMAVVETDLPEAIKRREPELERIAARYQDEMVRRELIPLIRGEVWPIVRRHVEPAVNQVSQEVLERASVWRFGWRYAYDKLPLTDRNLTQLELRRFLADEAIPVLESHTDDFMTMQQRIFRDVAANSTVREAARRSLGQVTQDEEVQRLAWEIVRETAIDNPRMKEVLRRHWQSPRTQEVLRQAAERVEPTAIRIGELLFGSPERGLSPEFALVLRNHVLGKDRRWFMLDAAGVAGSPATGKLALRVSRGSPGAVHPYVAQAARGMWN